MTSSLRNHLFVRPSFSNTSGWVDRHMEAVNLPKSGFERAFIEMLSGWLRYADAHSQAYASGIGEDGFLGAPWAQIGAALRTLLNGEVGRFDAGTIDSLIAMTLEGQGFDPDRL